jgi:hypothetical protein
MIAKDTVQKVCWGTVKDIWGGNSNVWHHISTLSTNTFTAIKGLFISTRSINEQLFADDAVCGANTIEDMLKLQQELITLLGQQDFLCSSFVQINPTILEAVPPDCREMQVPIELDCSEVVFNTRSAMASFIRSVPD